MYNTTKTEASAALQQLIYSRAQQMSRQITRAAEEFGVQSANNRKCKFGVEDEARSAMSTIQEVLNSTLTQ